MKVLNQMEQEPEYQRRLLDAKAFIMEKDRFLVVSHISPDGDAIGSTLAMGQMLSQLGKSYSLINEHPVPNKFQVLPGYSDILELTKVEADAVPPQFDCVIALDCADYKRIGRVSEWLTDGLPMLNIDHHPTNDGYGTVNLIHAEAAATAEILYDLANILDIQWDEPLAACLYTGLLTDTGGFRYSNTTPQIMNIASEMLRYGVAGNELADQFLEKFTVSYVMVLQKALATLSFSEDKKIAWMNVALEDIASSGAVNGDLEGLVNYPRNIEGVEVGLLLKESEQDIFKVSFRSTGKVNVAILAQKFGGGGHVRAAGCTISGKLEQVKETVLQEVRKAIDEN